MNPETPKQPIPPWVRLLIAAAIAWHLLAVLAPAWVTVSSKPSRGRDFASYYYALQVARDGGDAYARGSLGSAARQDGERRGVHPFLYPPPFLLLMSWALPLDLMSSYHLWFWLDEMWMLLSVLALWRWWRPLGPAVGATLAVMVALNTAIPANHVMGQANFPGLALAILGLWASDRQRPILGGALVGAACMVKMSPALFVGWWLMKGRWREVFSACAAAVLLSIVALPLMGFEQQLAFYQRVLRTFGSGDYNGLTVPIGMFGNHSIPNLLNQALPGQGRTLSWVAQALSSVSMIGIIVGLGALFHGRREDLLSQANQVGAIGIALLLVPVYTYEHHCIWALPAVVSVVTACVLGRLGPRWWIPVALACTVWCVEIMHLKAMFTAVSDLPVLPWLLQELKFAALLMLGIAASVAGSSYNAHEPEFQ